MMKILVTGGAGFIGSHLTDALIKNGHQTVVVDDLSHGFKEFLNPKAKFYKTKIESKKISNILKKEKIEIINHHAAKIGSPGTTPQEDVETNILGTVNLLEAAKETQIKHFIFASSAAVYGEAKILPTKEKDFKTPSLFYGLSKLAAEKFVDFYSNYFKTTILRYSNVYGPRQDSSAEGGVVAIFLKKMIQNQKVLIYGNGKQTRDFIYVDDVVEANLKALNLKRPGIFNISTQKETSILSLQEKIKKITHCQKGKTFKPEKSGDIRKNCLSNKKAKRVLKWRPRTSLEKGLAQTDKYFLS